MLMEHQRPLSLNKFENYYKLCQGTTWINFKTSNSAGKVKKYKKICFIIS